MKRIFLLILVLLILLSGCAQQAENPPQTTVPPETQPDPGCYIPNSDTERTTAGSVRVYNIPDENALWVAGIGDNLLLATGKDSPTLTVLSGENCVIAGSLKPDFSVDNDCQMTVQGIAYYAEETNEAVYLDHTLQVISKVSLPEKPDSMPLFSADSSEIYYCVGNDIRAYDTMRNISRPVKNQLVESQTLQSILFDGKVLCCEVTYETGDRGTVYLDSQTGKTLSSAPNITILETNASGYVALRQDGFVRQEIFGALDAEAFALDLPDDAVIIPALALNGMVSAKSEAAGGSVLSLFDFTTGTVSAEIVLTDVAEVRSGYTDKWNRCIWFLGEDKEGITHIYRWEPAKNSVKTDVSYKTSVYTAEKPDTEGLAACKTRADVLNKTYSVDIRLWEAALAETGKHAVIGEYQTNAIKFALDELEKVMKKLPEKFLRKSANRPLHIGIVRSVDGGMESAQFYKKTGAYILIPIGPDLQEEFIRALGYVVNSRVVSNTPILDSWASLNPGGFTYGTENEELINVAFADKKAMQSIVEDRCSVFRYAMETGNEELFASDVMQQKLILLCKGIRDVWGWEKETGTYPWEQYLHNSIAYVKK